MAEEKESTQKPADSRPKAELIKHAQNEHEVNPSESGASSGSGAQDHSERRKVIVVKKKPAGPARKAQPKVVVNRGTPTPGGEHTATKPAEERGGTLATTERRDTEVRQKEQASAGPVSSAGEQPARKPAEAKPTPQQTETKPPETGQPAATKPAVGVTSFPLTRRPQVAVGKVGGKFVGPRPPVDNSASRSSSGVHSSPSPFPQRPPSAVGRVGGRPVGRRDERGGDNRTGQQGGGGRWSGQDRGGAPRPAGPRPGGAPVSRPGNFSGSRPVGGRPPIGQRSSGAAPQTSSLTDGKTPVKKTFKAKKPVYTRREKEKEMEEKLLQTKKKIAHIANPVPKSIDIMEVVSVSDLARKMNLKASDLIQKLMRLGMMVTINQQIDADTATLLAAEFGADVRIISLYDETVIETAADNVESMFPRPPVVTVMGHVDHGKTKLLDAIRSANVVAGEFGGITQHIGAYMVDTPNGRISFLDTPGHEAFTRMRARGAQVTDIVVLVVAADDGVMPQTIEAINHAREANVPIIVAVNKIDKAEANPDKVKSQLSDMGLQPEEWGGQTMFVEISALKKQGIDKLIESILLQAEILDIKADYNRNAEGKVLESRIDHGRGTVATVMIEKGTLHVGDSFVAGVWPGRVRALFNDKGERVEEATPAMPIEVIGFEEGIPNAGDPMQVVEDEKIARSISAKRQELKRFEDAKNIKKITLDTVYQTIRESEMKELKVIIKSDVQGSAEALRSSLEKLSNKEVRLNVIQALPGAINEGDVELAIASNAIIVGFNVRPIPKAKTLADQEKVDIRKYNIIYKAVEEIKLAMEGMLTPDTKEELIATVEVRNTFIVPKVGTIAGCYVLTGTVKRSASVNLIRDHVVIHSGKISSLRRFKDDVREVAAGYECGMGIEDFSDIKVDDQIEVFEIVEVARKLS
ncbi:MAG: translation initiation factor IF-2 [Treponema sp.]|jgi:translation initiation factor IF-2|nr:translation initiation factor IF-2 [Treponema sp.]